MDHAFIIAGGKITKQARTWPCNALDNANVAVQFIDRDDILNLYVLNTNHGVPVGPAWRPRRCGPPVTSRHSERRGVSNANESRRAQS
jgi:hypothetical protein